MLTLETLATFLPAAVLLALAPGPDNIFVLTQSAIRGRASGIAVTIGLCLGLMVHTTAVAFGVAAVFQRSELAFSLLKFAGAAYLAYLSWVAFTAKPSKIEGEATDQPGPLRLVGRGAIMNLTNPKVSLFFLAFLPQFIDPAGRAASQMLMLGGLFIIVTIIVFGSIALFSGTLGSFFRKSVRGQLVLNRIAATVYLLLALRLVTMHR